MKVLMFINSLGGGGAERIVATLSKEMVKVEGVTVDLITLYPGSAFDLGGDKNIQVHQLLNKKINRFVDLPLMIFHAFFLLKKLGINKYDLVFSHLPLADFVCSIVAGKNQYIVFHSTFSKIFLGLKQRLAKLLYRNKRIICVSQGVKDDLLSIGVTPVFSKVIYNPFVFSEIKALSNIKINLPFDGDYIITAGRLCREKRFDNLIEALSHLKQDVKLVILGEGGELKKLQEIALDFGVSDRVIFAGWQSNPFAWIKEARLYVLSSDFEGLPTALIESAICGVNSVSTDCPSGPREILIGEHSQYLCEPANPELLAVTIDKALTASFLDTESLKLERFESSVVVKEYLDLAKENG